MQRKKGGPTATISGIAAFLVSGRGLYPGIRVIAGPTVRVSVRVTVRVMLVVGFWQG